jgi:hypothetical protein
VEVEKARGSVVVEDRRCSSGFLYVVATELINYVGLTTSIYRHLSVALEVFIEIYGVEDYPRQCMERNFAL